jgi:hypothetical protein
MLTCIFDGAMGISFDFVGKTSIEISRCVTVMDNFDLRKQRRSMTGTIDLYQGEPGASLTGMVALA